MTVPHMLRVKPHTRVGAKKVPMQDGSKLHTGNCPDEGLLVADSVYVRRRVMFNELVIVAEGKAALPPPDVIPAKTASVAPAPPPATKGAST